MNNLIDDTKINQGQIHDFKRNVLKCLGHVILKPHLKQEVSLYCVKCKTVQTEHKVVLNSLNYL